MAGMTVTQAEQARRKYVAAYNATMIKIWKERIIMLGAIDTGALLKSVAANGAPEIHDAHATSATMRQQFEYYGLYVDFGTGSNTWRGNPGDIGERHETNRRRRKEWFSRKHYASVMKTREVFAETIGQDIAEAVSNAMTRGAARRYAI